MKKITLSVIPGDGVGKEIMPHALRVLDAVAEVHGGLTFEKVEYPWSCEYYLEHGEMMPEDGLVQLTESDAVFLGAVGNPQLVPDHVSLWGLLIAIRRGFQQSLNIRHAKQIRGIDPPIKHANQFDLLVVRENSEGEYSEVGGRIHQGDDEVVVQNAIFTKKATKRAIDYAFQLAATRGKRVTSATKSNGIVFSMPFWDNVFQEVGKQYPDIEQQSVHIDALTAFLVTKPAEFDVIVASNLFGDILTDVSAAIMGSIGIGPAANLNVEGTYPSMFEPVHGSAPDIVGKGMANPIGQIWTGKMMLDHFGEEELGKTLLDIVEDVTEAGIKTPDIGGRATTGEVADAIIERVKSLT
ncbi:tartrate dehydrogenase [Halalkalibacterium halodurans]|uniref:D-malate dehydrogenase (decarboxylating) n=1 Tax=Halalkalibacterium halodurans (strain ATCC BAA-125 / DSM 18197 / FERM 7344 / JCM 9153 / C-125) TaxID=272558 RepID=Q9KDZ1_HALH5|nr:tartrate dehydrogenase [Halalkalibacterium halodurans]MED4079273.1 tartrate dehydrogenase [Halalkalibacterium halodurans]MED4085344.1 tartrate dehydrogenase [Halalkalibacterium halodurans]MED4105380.1 tartrate dehydrogenase [Halalkalibacterium halodurans]MED4108209.1 tartrate dehydrogenase [Halalkalibacterium halodurans]MED4124106.1 tartrate dehydrogenase [Halalkalibacterium halodurans]